MKVLVISKAVSGEDRQAWSGSVYRTLQSLRGAGLEVDYLCARRDYRESFFDKLLCTYWLRIPKFFGKSIRMDESLYMVRLYRQTLRNFDYTPYQVVFIPTYWAIVAALPQRIRPKVVHLVDATPDSLFEYYTEFSNLWFHNYWEAHYIGRKAFRRSDLLIASSDWCKNNAITTYGVAEDCVKVIEFGANLDDIDIPARSRSIDGKEVLHIFWCGVNWERKGGDVAVACCDELLHRGIGVELHIMGMPELPPDVAGRPYVRHHGYLSKNNPSEYARMIQVMQQQDIFLFPSKAECSSIAVCEAAGFGMPCFAYDTGGMRNYILNGINGYLLPLLASGTMFADRIEECYRSHSLNALSQGAIARYRTHLNWNRWGKMVAAALRT